jgi:hypothetical protein
MLKCVDKRVISADFEVLREHKKIKVYGRVDDLNRKCAIT